MMVEKPDDFDLLAGPQTAITRTPKIPKVVVRREWPYFKDPEDEDVESLDCVANDIDSLWRGIAESTASMDDPEFFGATADYLVDGLSEPLNIDCGNIGFGDARIAIANYRYAIQQCKYLLGKPCWKAIKTYPPVNVLAVMFHEYFPSDFDAIQTLRFRNDHPRAIEKIEQARREGVAIVASTMAMFFASLWAEGIHKPERNDDPTETEIENGRRVLNEMGVTRTTVEAFRKAYRIAGYKAGNTKTSLIYKKITTKPSPPSRGDGSG